MSERLPEPSPPEVLRLQYYQGWQEILTAPDAADYQRWMEGLADLTQRVLQNDPGAPEWARSVGAITNRWQRAIELVADAAIDPADKLTEAERVETGLVTLKANVESIGWEIEGVAFVVPNLFTGEEAVVDLREMQSVPEAND